MIQTLEWTDAGVRFIDQTKLPTEEIYVTCTTYEQVADVIRNMVVRGAPAIGVAAAMGIALGVKNSKAETGADLKNDFDQICDVIGETRPTAVNLFWAIRRMQDKFETLRMRPVPQIKQALIEEAQRMHAEDIAANQAMGRHGAALMPASGGVLTHCNAGALATAGYGTALGVIRAAVEQGKKIHVYADETRPFLQGSRLTAWELMKDGIPTTVISDNMAGAMMGRARSARSWSAPTASPPTATSPTRSALTPSRCSRKNTAFRSTWPRRFPRSISPPPTAARFRSSSATQEKSRTSPASRWPRMASSVENPAFDVTPAKYVTAIITERGVLRAPYAESIGKLAISC